MSDISFAMGMFSYKSPFSMGNYHSMGTLQLLSMNGLNAIRPGLNSFISMIISGGSRCWFQPLGYIGYFNSPYGNQI